jgi:crotonobetainyl-CoA:carnitine CoA-transferase CaiB-like acyl-CoA transferase
MAYWMSAPPQKVGAARQVQIRRKRTVRFARERNVAILSNVRVVDLTRVVAGPWATQTLADLGAEVIKIEKPSEGDDTRRMGPFLADEDGRDSNDSAFFMACNRGKRSVTMDIAREQGQDLLRRLAAQSDIFIENYKQGALARYGLDYQSIRAVNPRIIYCSITGFGQDGPYAARPAYDFILQGMSGLMSTCGQPDGAPGAGPMRTAIPLTDIATGLYATISILAALIHRDRTGEGQFIDAAMLDASVALNGHLAIGYLMTGKIPQRIGNANPIASPSEVFATRDGRLIVAAGNNGQFQALAREIGLPELSDDPRFKTNGDRVRNRMELVRVVAARLISETNAFWVERLSKAGVPCGPINDLDEVFDDPQVRHRGVSLTVAHGRGVEVPMLKSPLNLSASPVDYRAAPQLGEGTRSVLESLLNLSSDEIAALRAAQVI